MFISFSSVSYIKIVRFEPRGDKVEKKVDMITLLPNDKIELSTDVIGFEVKEPNLPARVTDIVANKSVSKADPDLLTLYYQLEDKCAILGITPEDYIKQNKPSLF